MKVYKRNILLFQKKDFKNPISQMELDSLNEVVKKYEIDKCELHRLIFLLPDSQVKLLQSNRNYYVKMISDGFFQSLAKDKLKKFVESYKYLLDYSFSSLRFNTHSSIYCSKVSQLVYSTETYSKLLGLYFLQKGITFKELKNMTMNLTSMNLKSSVDIFRRLLYYDYSIYIYLKDFFYNTYSFLIEDRPKEYDNEYSNLIKTLRNSRIYLLSYFELQKIPLKDNVKEHIITKKVVPYSKTILKYFVKRYNLNEVINHEI